MKFMFRALHGGSVDKDGVLIPWFVYQVFGPLLGIIQLIIGIVFIRTSLTVVGATFLAFILFEGLYSMAASLILYYINLKKECIKRKCTPKEFKYMAKNGTLHVDESKHQLF